MDKQVLYLYFDEGGNLDFSRHGSKYFSLSCLATYEPNIVISELNELRHKLVSQQKSYRLDEEMLNRLSERFHASEDRQQVRDDVFSILIGDEIPAKFFSIIINKHNYQIDISKLAMKLYCEQVAALIAHISGVFTCERLCIFIDGCPIGKKQTFTKATKTAINKHMPGLEYYIYCPASATNFNLQIIDYINWAVFRSFESPSKKQSLDLIRKHLDLEIVDEK